MRTSTSVMFSRKSLYHDVRSDMNTRDVL